MKRIVASLALAFALASCNLGEQLENHPTVYYWHDDAHGVSCWLWGYQGGTGKAISCLRDADR